VERFLTADAPSLDRDALLRLHALAREGRRPAPDVPDLDVRALALAALHYAGGERVGVRRFLAERLWAAGADDAPLRARWATALGVLGDRLRARGDGRGAATAYRKALELRPTDPRLLLNLGLALAAAGDAPGAAAEYRRALAVDAAQPLALVNLGVALEAQGELGGAADAYRRAIAVDAYEPMAYANLGNAYLRGGDAAAAIPLYERALALDPSLASVHFALAQARGQRGELAAALAALRRGLSFDSSDAQVRALAETLAERLRAGGGGRTLP
jgi:tetratricopeptide (TPR) repeat protein